MPKSASLVPAPAVPSTSSASRALIRVRQGDVTRVIRGAIEGGLTIQRVEVDAKSGTIVITTNAGPEQAGALDKWLTSDARQT